MRRIDYASNYSDTLNAPDPAHVAMAMELAGLLIAAVDEPESLPLSDRTITILQNSVAIAGIAQLTVEQRGEQ